MNYKNLIMRVIIYSLINLIINFISDVLIGISHPTYGLTLIIWLSFGIVDVLYLDKTYPLKKI